jgi:hypothetical protein
MHESALDNLKIHLSEENSMRKLIPVHVAASVVIAIAGTSAFAQTTAPGAGIRNATVTSAPQIGGGQNTTTRSSTGTPTTTGSVFKPSEPVGTDVRNQQNLQATQGTRSSGPSPTSTTTATSTTNGTGTGSSSVNGSGSVTNPNGTGTDTSGTNTGTNTVTAPLLFNGVIGSDMGTSDAVYADNGASSNNQVGVNGANGVNAGAATNDTVRSSANLDRVIKQAERDRRKIGRNGQLLYSIAPRTNVDRSNEMPDDGPTPALKGLLSR